MSFRALNDMMARVVVALSFFWLAMAASPASAAVCAPATTQGTAPPTWQTYCWLDFTDLVEATARSAAGQNFSYILSDGATLSFNMKLSGTPVVVSRAAPSWTGAAVGNTAFLGIPNRPILYQQAGGTNTVTFSSIAITPPPGVSAVTQYMFVAADAESTNQGEALSFNTNGGNWQILDQVDPISGSQYPTIAGAGTQTFTETGVAGTVGGYIVGSTSPTTVTTTLVGGGLQGAMFAVRFASMRLNKTITGARVDPADQFKFDISATSSGSILGTGTTTGTGLGPFTAAAVSLASGLPLTLSETMAAGSASALSQYRSLLTCTNGTTGSSTPVPTNVQTTNYSFGTLQFGDAIQCVFNNTPFPHVRLQKALGAGGRQFNTDQFTVAIRQGAATTASATTTGTGTTITTGSTPMTQLVAATAYTLNENAAGTTTLSNYTQALACTNAWTGSTTTLPTTLGGTVTPQPGDVITCTITNTRKAATANLTFLKSSQLISDPSNNTTNPKMIPGALVNYSLQVNNFGPSAVDANTVFILDPLPAQMSYNTGVTVGFIDGSTPNAVSGLAGTWNAANDVRFAGAGSPPANFAACTLPAGTGINPAIRYVCIRPSGTMAGSTGAPTSFTIVFQTQIQ